MQQVQIDKISVAGIHELCVTNNSKKQIIKAVSKHLTKTPKDWGPMRLIKLGNGDGQYHLLDGLPIYYACVISQREAHGCIVEPIEQKETVIN